MKRRRQRFNNWSLTHLLAVFPWVLATFYWWGILVLLFVYVEPDLIKDLFLADGYVVVPVFLFLALSFTFYLFSRIMWRSLLWALAVSLFVGLRFVHLGNMVNALLLLALLAVTEYYFRSRDN